MTKPRWTYLGFNSYDTMLSCFHASGSFQIFLKVLKQLTHYLVMFFQVLLASEIGLLLLLRRYFFQFFVLKFFRYARIFFILEFKIIILETSKPVSACRIRYSIVTVSLNKNSMYFSGRFVLNKVGQ